MTVNVFRNVSRYDDELKEIIALYEALPFNDPYKEDLFNNIYDLIEYENEFNNPRFRIINKQTPGTTYLREIGTSATKIQEMFSSAYKKVASMSENIQNQLLLDKTSMLVNIRNGSIVFELEKIGINVLGQEDLIDININKVDLLNDLVQDAYLISEDEKNLKLFIGKYGTRTLKNFKEFIIELEYNDSYFEYSDLASNVNFMYSKEHIQKVISMISNFEPIETVNDYDVKGLLIGISTENGKLFFRNYDDQRITVTITDDSLTTNKIVVNNYYQLTVKKTTVETLDSIKDFYECDSINGTSISDEYS